MQGIHASQASIIRVALRSCGRHAWLRWLRPNLDLGVPCVIASIAGPGFCWLQRCLIRLAPDPPQVRAGEVSLEIKWKPCRRSATCIKRFPVTSLVGRRTRFEQDKVCRAGPYQRFTRSMMWGRSEDSLMGLYLVDATIYNSQHYAAGFLSSLLGGSLTGVGS